MADWKQITARIRRARTSKEPAAQLTNLFAKTRDAMVAFELARYFESVGNTGDAGRWFLTASERFRRSDWKTKAQENATRLGATEPAEIPQPVEKTAAAETDSEEATERKAESGADETDEAPAEREETATEERKAEPPSASRGRRAEHSRRPGRREHQASHRGSRSESPRSRTESEKRQEEPEPPARSSSRSHRASEDSPEAAIPALRGRFGDPGLSSRLSQLEMNFRRLLSSDPTKLEDADKAPAGPGVWVLTDSDLSTYYYVEACQTLRVAIPNLLRSGNSRRGGGNESIKPMLAEHLGIAENRVAKYLSDHCVVRWLQMDEGASHFAHFLVAVLRPTLNE